MAKLSSDVESKKPAKERGKLGKRPYAMLCKGTRKKPLNGDYACHQVLGLVGKNGVSISCRRCKTIVEFTWQELRELKRLRESMSQGK